jgi:hypothetical protein
MHRRFPGWLMILATMASGCGPMLMPMTYPLSEQEQKTVDGMWKNMLSPVTRLDRQTLLDAILVNMVFQLGVDRLHMVAEKQVARGKVVMVIDCDRAKPAGDQFALTVVDEQGRTLRQERYTRDEVEASAKALTPYQSLSAPAEREGAVTRPEAIEAQRKRAEYRRRMKAVEAATQPAGRD